MGQPLAESALSELVGAKVTGRLESVDNWVRFAEGHSSKGVVADDLPRDWPFLVKGPATIYETSTARATGELLKPHRTTRQREGKEGTEWPMSADAPAGPALLINEIGQGMVLTLAASPDFATASEHHTVEARRLLANAVRFLHPSPRIQITAPANVETVITDDPANRIMRVHFIAYNPTPQTMPVKDRPYVLPGLIEDAPMFRAAITTREPLKDVSALNRSTEIKREGLRVEAIINDIHEVLVLSY
jgi:hypothetical protein